MTFILDHRYQDSGWIPVAGLLFDYQGDAEIKAQELAMEGSGMVYGMTRVIRDDPCGVVARFSAGGDRL